jgi:hypothetical protein
MLGGVPVGTDVGADGMAVSLLFFAVGQAWVIYAEFRYLVRIHPLESWGRLLKATVAMNALSTLAGGTLLVALLLGLHLPPQESPEAWNVVAAGAWIAGGIAPQAHAALHASALAFAATTALAVPVEYGYLSARSRAWALPPTAIGHCVALNVISATGLAVLSLLPSAMALIYGWTVGV